jgi:hypothetical protein
MSDLLRPLSAWMEITLNDGSVEMFVVVGDMLGDSSNGELLAAIDSASARVKSGEAVRFDVRVR